MTPHAARLLCLLTLAGVFAPQALRLALGAAAVPAWAALPPGFTVALLLLIPACLLLDSDYAHYGRLLALAALALAVFMLLANGIAEWRGSVRSASLLDRLRPTTPAALGLAALAASLVWRRDLQARLDLSAVLGVLACALFFLLLVAHVFQAAALIADPSAPHPVSSMLGALLLLMLALAALGQHEGSPMMAYLGDDTGAVAMRRLLPAAVLVPISIGLLLQLAIEDRGLPLALAVALAVASNTAVMLLMIHAAGERVSRVSQAREKSWQSRGARDALTGLLNRGAWDTAVQLADRRCRSQGIEACVLMIDLDGLKRINDSQGHAAGDALIQAAGAALAQAARRGDTLARLGGDEFAYLAVDCDAAMAANIATRFEQALAQAPVAASVGYALTRQGAVLEALQSADQAMYQRKRARQRRAEY